MTTLFPNKKLICSFLTRIHTRLIFSQFCEKSQDVKHKGCTYQHKNLNSLPQETQEPGKLQEEQRLHFVRGGLQTVLSCREITGVRSLVKTSNKIKKKNLLPSFGGMRTFIAEAGTIFIYCIPKSLYTLVK